MHFNCATLLPLVTMLFGAALLLPPLHARPQDASTNNIVRPAEMTQEDRESLVASLILAVARDWDLGREEATEFIRAVPAISVNGTTFGPTTHPINESGPISFSASPDEMPV